MSSWRRKNYRNTNNAKPLKRKKQVRGEKKKKRKFTWDYSFFFLEFCYSEIEIAPFNCCKNAVAFYKFYSDFYPMKIPKLILSSYLKHALSCMLVVGVFLCLPERD